MYYILKISNKAFIKVEENFDLVIVQEPERATQFDRMGDAMFKAAEINTDWVTGIVQVISVG